MDLWVGLKSVTFVAGLAMLWRVCSQRRVGASGRKKAENRQTEALLWFCCGCSAVPALPTRALWRLEISISCPTPREKLHLDTLSCQNLSIPAEAGSPLDNGQVLPMEDFTLLTEYPCCFLHPGPHPRAGADHRVWE